jgi:hypothetical protein
MARVPILSLIRRVKAGRGSGISFPYATPASPKPRESRSLFGLLRLKLRVCREVGREMEVREARAAVNWTAVASDSMLNSGEAVGERASDGRGEVAERRAGVGGEGLVGGGMIVCVEVKLLRPETYSSSVELPELWCSLCSLRSLLSLESWMWSVCAWCDRAVEYLSTTGLLPAKKLLSVLPTHHRLSDNPIVLSQSS